MQSELQVHLAEYAALTSRNTNWITLQYAMWPILLVYYGLVAGVWTTLPHELLIWASGVVTQLAVLHWCESGYEVYNNVAYMERQLRLKIAELLPGRDFWGYEPHLKVQRGSAPIWYEYVPLLGILVGLVIAVYLSRHKDKFGMWDWIGIGLNAVLFCMVAKRTINLIMTRQRMNK